MVFSSLPVYLDPPNWQQQNNSQGIDGISGGENSQFLLHSGAAQQQHAAGSGSVLGPFRPGSMADRARIANLPLPEVGLKCPRCESTHTKFCYFNNYCLSQPRHFCKTCRRYWTKGGALRNVPVGGGCRRNKKNKRASSKSPASMEVCSGTEELVNHQGHPLDQDHTTLPLTRFPSLDQYSFARRLGLSFPEFQTNGSHEPSATCESGCPELAMLPAMDAWRPPEIKPFHSIMTGLEQHPLFQLEGMTETPQMSTIPSLAMAGDPCGIQPRTIPYSTTNRDEDESSFVLKMSGSSQSSNVVDYWLHPSSSYI